VKPTQRESIDIINQLICSTCNNRIGWTGEHTEEQSALGRSDWRKCSTCRRARTHVAQVEAAEIGDAAERGTKGEPSK